MKVVVRLFSLTILLFFSSFIISSCGSKEKPTPVTKLKPEYGGRIIIGSIGEPIKLNPILYDDSPSGDIIGFVFNGLVNVDDNLNLIPSLAEKWEFDEKGLKWKFYLKKGVKWHDGVEFTAEDVKFTIDKILDPKVNCKIRSNYELIKEVKVIDRYSLEISLKKPYAPFLWRMGVGILPSHILSKVDINTADFNRRPIGTGPYKFKEWRSGDRVILEANPDYFEGRPYIKEVVYKVVPNIDTLLVQLETGEVDLVDGIQPKDYLRLKQNPKIKLYTYDALLYVYFGFNLKNPLFQDIKVRYAIASAIDRSLIVENILKGFGMVAHSPIHPISWAYNPDIPKVEYDEERARQLLKSAGWKDIDGDGIVEKGGKEFKFTIVTNQGNKIREQIAVIIQQQLKKLGIEVKPRIVEWSSFIENFINKGNFDTTILGWISAMNDPDVEYDVWHSSQSFKEGRLRGNNFISYHNKEIDKLFEEGRVTMDKDKRKKIYFKIQEILAKELPYVFLYHPKVIVAIRDRFAGVTPPGPAGPLLHLDKWWVKK